MRHLFLLIICFVFSVSFAQDKTETSYIDLNYFRGSIPLHNDDILHLIDGFPEGYVLSWNKKTYGFKDWQQRYNYPDYGVSFAYQNMKNTYLGSVSALYAHYNFYFLKRRVMLRIATGAAYTEDPYNKATNFRNIAYGSHIMSSTLVMLNYNKQRIFGGFGLQAGATLIHYSNGNVKAPNTSTNTVAFNFGLNYSLDKTAPEYQNTLSTTDRKYTEPIHFNMVFRSGINESDVVGSGQFPLYVFSAYADKRINRKSGLQFGTDIFFSKFLKELIAYKSVAFPNEGVSGDEDYRRVGVFVGHELFVSKTSLISQLGYYLYYPFDFEGRTYVRLALKRNITKNWFGLISIKAHGAKAEAIELGVGVRL